MPVGIVECTGACYVTGRKATIRNYKTQLPGKHRRDISIAQKTARERYYCCAKMKRIVTPACVVVIGYDCVV